jgi:hypothetical protein
MPLSGLRVYIMVECQISGEIPSIGGLEGLTEFLESASIYPRSAASMPSTNLGIAI